MNPLAGSDRFEANCPSCGAPVKFTFKQAVQTVCGFCKSVLVRQGVVLDLSMSIQKALRSLDGLVIEGHLRTHVVEQMTGGETDRAVGELLRLYKVQGPADA